MIGPGGRAILDFYFSNQTILNVFFVIWAVIMTYGSMQLTKIREHTIKMSITELEKDPELSNEQLWEKFRPLWQEEIKGLNVRFVLNRWNFWVTRPTPEALIPILRLGPDWFEAIRKGEVLRYRFLIAGKNEQLSSFK